MHVIERHPGRRKLVEQALSDLVTEDRAAVHALMQLREGERAALQIWMLAAAPPADAESGN